MDAASDDLTRPLGRDGRTARASGRWQWALGVATVACGVVGIAALVGSAIYGDPSGGRPVARSEIAIEPAPASLPGPVAGDVRPSDRSRRDARTVEAESGVSVVRPDGSAAPGSVVVQVPDAAPEWAGPNPLLLEKTRHGLLPRIGPDGARPFEAYARRAGELPGGARVAGRIAVVVGGLGIGRLATEDAIARLPPAVTLAFAPYGADLDRDAGRARATGHEIILQIPMEPFDFPDSDPGPHTLMAGGKAAENGEHLHWAMGRLTGYVGLMNYMGAKLTADERALAPILREAGGRGLAFLDDGSSSRSRVLALAGGTPSARADIVLDAVPRADLIDKALERLETIALSGRLAVATASALPVTTERLVRWAQTLEARGLLLVPASAALVSRTREAAAP